MGNNLYSSETTRNVITSLSSRILEIKEKYLNSGFKEKEFSSFMISNVNDILLTYNYLEHGDRDDYVCKILTFMLDEKIKKEIENKINLVVDFIERNINENSSVYQSIKNLIKILNYIQKQKLTIDLDIINLLSLKSSKLNSTVLNIINFINEKQDNKIIENFDEITDFIDGFCSLKDIALYVDEVSDTYYITDAVKQYLHEISKFKVLSKEESYVLEQQMVMGDERAKELLIKHNLRLVVTIAKRYLNRGLDLLDLIQHGNMGLVKSTEKFDINKGVKFSSYAGWGIRQSINRGLETEARMIRKPTYIEATLLKIERKEKELTYRNNCSPTYEEIANELGMGLDEITFLKSVSESVLSLNNFKENDESREYISYLKADDDTENEAITNVLIQNLLNNYLEIGLTEEEINILKYRNGFYENRVFSHRELAPKFGISAARVQQIERDAILRLRDYYEGTHNFKKGRNKKKRQAS